MAPTRLLLRGSFAAAAFDDRYQRNNKRGGLKNLRCFPQCSPVHKERGFCGSSVQFTVSGPLLEAATLCGLNLVVIADFVSEAQPATFVPGRTYSEAAIAAQLRDCENPMRPIMRAEPLRTELSDVPGERRVVFEFNRRRKGWHYGWTANKHSCNTRHSMCAYILVQQQPPAHGGAGISGGDPDSSSSSSNGSRQSGSKGSDDLLCLDATRSPSFVLYCRRRRRFSKSVSAPQAEGANEQFAAALAAMREQGALLSGKRPLESDPLAPPCEQKPLKAARRCSGDGSSDGESEATVSLEEAAARTSGATAQAPPGAAVAEPCQRMSDMALFLADLAQRSDALTRIAALAAP